MKKKILVVDDDKSILQALKLVLDEFDYKAELISDATETVEAVIKQKPDLIILDVLLSGIDGRELCKELKTNSLTKHTPILLLSAHSSVEKNVKKYKADDFLEKPFDLDVLIGKIKKLTR